MTEYPNKKEKSENSIDPEKDLEKVDETTLNDSDKRLEHPQRVRRRIKVRKRVRIKKKPSSKKKFRKIGEKIFWIALIVGFIISLIIMIVQLDISDQKFKKQRKKKSSSIMLKSTNLYHLSLHIV